MRTILCNVVLGTVIGLLAFSTSRAVASDAGQQKPAEFHQTTKVTTKYLLYLPKDYDQRDSWPVLLFLHGIGERGDNLDLVKKHGPPKLIAGGKQFPFIVVSPQCPNGHWWLTSELTALLDEIAKKYKVDQDRIYLTGLSMGGFGTWSLAAYQPNRFAAIVPICGGGDPASAKRIAHIPAWVFHGGKDPVVPVAMSQKMVEALKKNGGNPKLTIYPEAMHDSWTQAYNTPELYEWLLQQKRAEKKPETPILAATALGPGDHTQSLTHDGLARSYLVHIPPQYDAKKPTPVVLIFHGAMTDAAITVRFTGLNEKSDKEGFIAVYPNGTGRLEPLLTWNGGNCCGSAQRSKVDDVGFTRALLDDLAKVTNVDSKRVFATGISNGGIMCYRLASELSDRIAAIAPVSGTMGMATCNPTRPVSVMHFHGTDDKFVPFKGGKGDRSLASINFFSVDHSIQAWVKADGCPEKPAVSDEPKKVDDGTAVERKTYGPGKEGAEVILFTINGGGHTWPGRDPKLQLLGNSTKNISANDLMWEFFKRHPMK